ncbi:MAG: hypothetical protein E6583_00795 [Clostridium sp.]|nr:hypothetical protein [Clostridium sp.]
MKNKKYIRKATNFVKSITFIIILGLLGFLYGINIGRGNSYLIDNILIKLGIVISIGLLMYIYLKANIFNSLVASINEKKLIKYLYFLLVLLFFTIYYLHNKDNFINTYQINSIGIDQNQYIFIVNFIGFFLISFILYNLILKDYSIKRLSKNDIELSEELDVADQQSKLINKYEEIIQTYSQVVCNIDIKMNYLNNENLIRNDYEVEEYIIVIDEFIKEFILINKDISIVIKPYELFDEFAADELGCNSFNIRKIKFNIETNRVYTYKNRIYIMYKSSIINNNIVLIIDMDNIYPGELGLLIYSYLSSVETSYSKYLIDINGGVVNDGE